MKKLLLAAFVVFCGCVSAGERYSKIFNESLRDGDSRVMISSRHFDDLSKNALAAFELTGYEKAVYYRVEDGFYVLVKNQKMLKTLASGNAMSRAAMIKFTRRPDGTIRIDLVNAGADLMARREVDRDLIEIEKLIETGE